MEQNQVESKRIELRLAHRAQSRLIPLLSLQNVIKARAAKYMIAAKARYNQMAIVVQYFLKSLQAHGTGVLVEKLECPAVFFQILNPVL